MGRCRRPAFLLAAFAFFWCAPQPGSAASDAPPSLPIVLQEHGSIHRYDPKSIVLDDVTATVLVRVYSEGGDDTSTILYELRCPTRSFQFLEVIEVSRRGTKSICTNPSGAISLQPDKHRVPAALFATFCH
jgi:hypothetical protein